MASVTYSSTRGCKSQEHLSFREVVMRGLAHDRGLFVPDDLPSVSKAELELWRPLSFADLAVEVLSKFIKEDQVPRNVMIDIVTRSCASFSSPDVTPLKDVNGHSVLVSCRVPYISTDPQGVSNELSLSSLFIAIVGIISWSHFCI
jgi:threonine synthase